MPDKGVGGAEQFAAHAGCGRECAHQEKQRNDREIEIGHRAHGGVTDDLECGGAVGQIAEAGNADEPHGHADRHAQQHQNEQRNETENGDGVSTHAGSLDRPQSGRPVARQELGMEDQPVGAHGDQQHGGDVAEPGHQIERPDRQPQIEG